MHFETKGVGVCLVDPSFRRVLLGLERFGKYRSKFNVCAGSLEPEDEGCFIKAARRELREEFKIDLDDDAFRKHFCYGPHNTLRRTMVGSTPVLIGYFVTSELDPQRLTQKMQKAIEDDALPGTQKEMAEAKWFDWDTNTSLLWSRFARIIVKKVVDRSTTKKRIFFS